MTALATMLPRPVRTLAVTITAFGTPAPQGSHKAFVVKGRAIVTNDSARTRPWRNTVAAAALDALTPTWTPLEGPLKVRAAFTLPKPSSAPKRRRSWPARRPDVDKLLRCLDALTDAGVWRDDGQIIELTGVKCYPGEDPEALDRPGVRVAVWTLHEPAPVTLDGAM